MAQKSQKLPKFHANFHLSVKSGHFANKGDPGLKTLLLHCITSITLSVGKCDQILHRDARELHVLLIAITNFPQTIEIFGAILEC